MGAWLPGTLLRVLPLSAVSAFALRPVRRCIASSCSGRTGISGDGQGARGEPHFSRGDGRDPRGGARRRPGARAPARRDPRPLLLVHRAGIRGAGDPRARRAPPPPSRHDYVSAPRRAGPARMDRSRSEPESPHSTHVDVRRGGGGGGGAGGGGGGGGG